MVIALLNNQRCLEIFYRHSRCRSHHDKFLFLCCMPLFIAHFEPIHSICPYILQTGPLRKCSSAGGGTEITNVSLQLSFRKLEDISKILGSFLFLTWFEKVPEKCHKTRNGLWFTFFAKNFSSGNALLTGVARSETQHSKKNYYIVSNLLLLYIFSSKCPGQNSIKVSQHWYNFH